MILALTLVGVILVWFGGSVLIGLAHRTGFDDGYGTAMEEVAEGYETAFRAGYRSAVTARELGDDLGSSEYVQEQRRNAGMQ